MAEKEGKAKKKAEVIAETVLAEIEKQPEAKLEVEKPSKATAKAGKRSAKAVKEAEAEQAKEKRKKSTAKAEEAPKETKKPPRTRLERAGKKYREAAKAIDSEKLYSLKEGLDTVVKSSTTKFDATIELHLNLGVDPKQADQNIRGTVVLPSGSGKMLKVAVADDKVLAELEKGEINFDVLVASPDMMPKLGKYAKQLGPKRLMPNPKSGTVSNDTAKAAEDARGGKVEYRVDSAGIIHLGIGKVSFGADKLTPNAEAIMAAVKSAKPSGVKGNYILSAYLATSMGPSVQLSHDNL